MARPELTEGKSYLLAARRASCSYSISSTTSWTGVVRRDRSPFVWFFRSASLADVIYRAAA